ncbi:MAG: YbbR-like domain-containing protein [Prevotella sp.]|nr:YbbR-like domain-containing protein [Prevotella sp.]
MIFVQRIIVIIRSFLFSHRNREFLIFLFFLMLSGIFWLLMTLNETYEKEVTIPVHITDIPADIMLNSDEADTVRVTIRDRGIILLAYLYGESLRHVEASFKNYDQGNGTGIISATELTKIVKQYTAASSKIVSIKPEKLKIYYNTGTCKKVPIRWKGRVIPEHLYFLSSVTYSPDSVMVYASEERLDSIHMVYTETLNYVDFRDTLAVDCHLRRMEGVKTVPSQVRVTFFTDVLTEERIDGIPIKCVNLPEGKLLRTFPAKASVKFVTGVNIYRTLSPDDFTVIADYKEIVSGRSEKCNLYLQQVPSGVTRATLVDKQVDYLIEEEAE